MSRECGLQSAFGEVALRVPDGPPGESDFIFRHETLPVPPARIETDRIVIEKGYHDYNGWYRADRLLMHVESDTARRLGVFVLACAFHRPPRAVLALSHPRSDILALVFRDQWLAGADPPVGLSTLPFAFRYFPGVTARHPWPHERDVWNLPLLALSSADELIYNEEQWRARDTVFLDSSLVGTVRLAELLLNAGCSWNRVREYELEGDAGSRGVAPMSAELQIVMPGSEVWRPLRE